MEDKNEKVTLAKSKFMWIFKKVTKKGTKLIQIPLDKMKEIHLRTAYRTIQIRYWHKTFELENLLEIAEKLKEEAEVRDIEFEEIPQSTIDLIKTNKYKKKYERQKEKEEKDS